MLGIPLRSFHKYVALALLPSFKLGRHRLFRWDDILEAMQRNRVCSKEEILR